MTTTTTESKMDTTGQPTTDDEVIPDITNQMTTSDIPDTTTSMETTTLVSDMPDAMSTTTINVPSAITTSANVTETTITEPDGIKETTTDPSTIPDGTTDQIISQMTYVTAYDLDKSRTTTSESATQQVSNVADVTVKADMDFGKDLSKKLNSDENTCTSN